MTVGTYAFEVRWNTTALVSDGDMEAAGTASYTATSCTLAKDSVTFFAGFQSLQGTNTAANGYASQSGALAAGQIVSIRVRARGGDASTKLQVYATPSSTLLGEMSNPNTTNWNELFATGKIPVGDTGYQVRMVNGSGAATVARWDELTIENWTDETAQLVSAEWRRGRDYAKNVIARASAGAFSALLNNPSGRYASFNASGPLYGNLLPGRKVRLRSTAPTAALLWQGFLEEILPSRGPQSGFAPQALLRAAGPLKWLAERRAATSVATSITTGAAIGKLLDDAGWPLSERNIETGQITLSRWSIGYDGETNALSRCQDIEDTEFGFLTESKDGKIVWQDGSHRTGLTSQATFSDAAAATLSYEDIQQADPWGEVFNFFGADVYYFTVNAIATLWTLSGETPSIVAGATKVFYATYPTAGSPTDADGVNAWTLPAATTDYTANTQANGLGTDKTAQIFIDPNVLTDLTNQLRISVRNGDAGTVFLTLLRARGTSVTRRQPIRIVSEDATSQAAYGKRTFPLESKLYPDTIVAKTYLDTALAKYKSPRAVLAFAYKANLSSSHMTQALTRDVSERITLVANNTAASGAQLGISAEFFIEAEHHHLVMDGSKHDVRYTVAPI